MANMNSAALEKMNNGKRTAIELHMHLMRSMKVQNSNVIYTDFVFSSSSLSEIPVQLRLRCTANKLMTMKCIFFVE